MATSHPLRSHSHAAKTIQGDFDEAGDLIINQPYKALPPPQLPDWNGGSLHSLVADDESVESVSRGSITVDYDSVSPPPGSILDECDRAPTSTIGVDAFSYDDDDMDKSLDLMETYNSTSVPSIFAINADLRVCNTCQTG